jgi:membrane protein DedA with SNARE-associated domain
MTDPMSYLSENGYVVVFMAVLIEQLGVPIPAAPLVVAAGALARDGQMSITVALGLVLVANLLADGLWYVLGKRYGSRVLHVLCRLSLEPDSCVNDARDGFTRHGAWLIVISKFVPGLQTMTPPLAGAAGIGLGRFALIDSAGILVQSVVLMAAGWWLREPVNDLLRWLSESGGQALIFIIGVPAVWIGWKYLRRRYVLRSLRAARVTPAEVKSMLDAGDPVMIVDLRHAYEQRDGSPTLPGALRMRPRELAVRHGEIPRDRDIILFCT